jgi:hypothetical protein
MLSIIIAQKQRQEQEDKGKVGFTKEKGNAILINGIMTVER